MPGPHSGGRVKEKVGCAVLKLERKRKGPNGKEYVYKRSEASAMKEYQAVRACHARVYEDLKVSLPKGLKAEVKAKAASRGLSMRQYIIDKLSEP